MAHKGRTIKRIIDDVNDVILRYSRIMSKQNHSLSREIIINPYILTNRDTSEIIKKIKDFNEGYFFISEPSVSVIKEYIDIVINEAVTVNDFFIQNHSEFDMATNRYLHTLGKELATLAKNLQEEKDSILPASPLLACYNGNAEKVKGFKLELQKHKELTPKKVIAAFLSQEPTFTVWQPKAIAEALSIASGLDISDKSIIMSQQIKLYRFND